MPGSLSDYDYDCDGIILFIMQLNLVIVVLWMELKCAEAQGTVQTFTSTLVGIGLKTPFAHHNNSKICKLIESCDISLTIRFINVIKAKVSIVCLFLTSGFLEVIM